MERIHDLKSSRASAMAVIAISAALVPGVPALAHCGSCEAKSSCSKAAKQTACSMKADVAATAAKAGSFTTLLKAATAAGLVETLKGPGPLTVFAPTDEAFAKLPTGTIRALLADKPKLRAVLKYHVVPGQFSASDVVSSRSLKSALGQHLAIDTSSGVRIAGASVIETDIAASNGIIHVIDSVMLPKPDVVDVATGAGGFETLLTAAKAAGMLDTLRGEGPLTVLAPTNEAFAKLPKGTIEALLKDEPKLRAILKYHLIPGKSMAADVMKLKSAKTALGQEVTVSKAKGVMINNAKVVKMDITAANGVIHVIDAVLLPKDDVIDVARKAGSFSTLLAAVDAAGLADTLRGAGPFTIFAPTDEAFAALPAGALDGLLKDRERLTAVLTYHVVGEQLSATELSKMESAKTAQGQPLMVRASGDGVMINEATVTQSDIVAANGTIHVIDQVILPPTKVSRGPSSSDEPES